MWLMDHPNMWLMDCPKVVIWLIENPKVVVMRLMENPKVVNEPSSDGTILRYVVFYGVY